MAGSTPWDELGIAPTDDLPTIRRAYAAALKAFDADAEPDRFGRLRDAYEAARTQATGRLSAAAVAVAEPKAAPPTEAPSPAALPIPTLDPAPFQLIEAILFSDRPPAEGDRAALATATRQLLADPAMDHIDNAQFVEMWLADAIAHGDDRADAMMPPALDQFRWGADDEGWNDHPIFRHLLERKAVVDLIARLQRPDDPFHRAYRELTISRETPSMTRIMNMPRGYDVLDLINAIRAEIPSAESRLDPERVRLWIETMNATGMTRKGESGFLDGNIGRWLVYIWLAMLGVSFVGMAIRGMALAGRGVH